MKCVVNNTAKTEETDFRERVGIAMKKQILKKFLPSGRNNDFKKVASHSFTKRNNIQQ